MVVLFPVRTAGTLTRIAMAQYPKRCYYRHSMPCAKSGPEFCEVMDAEDDIEVQIDPPCIRRTKQYGGDPPGKVPADTVLYASINFSKETAAIPGATPAHLAVLVPADSRCVGVKGRHGRVSGRASVCMRICE